MPQTFTVGARSLFVTLTAWAFMALGLLGAAAALLQGAALGGLLLSLEPPLQPWLAAALPWALRAVLALSLALAVSAAGLGLRHEGARRVFIGLLVLMLAGNLAGLALQQWLLQALAQHTLSTPLPVQAAGLVGGLLTATRAMALVVTLGGCALLGWILRRLMSPAVRQEFA